jgi:hypothetical protein
LGEYLGEASERLREGRRSNKTGPVEACDQVFKERESQIGRPI